VNATHVFVVEPQIGQRIGIGCVERVVKRLLTFGGRGE
jgi:hypothetical protein